MDFVAVIPNLSTKYMFYFIQET